MLEERGGSGVRWSVHPHTAHLERGDHGAEGKDSGTVSHCGLVVKGSLCVQQKHRHLHRAHDNTYYMLTILFAYSHTTPIERV